ncbi:hypothetical protein KBA73_01390 [Patescibacteria group bacterium]|nr:hypothetical protein [Patescibacteria group bacterium]
MSESTSPRPSLELIPSQEPAPTELPRLAGIELEEVCSLNPAPESFVAQFRKDPNRLLAAWSTLLTRNFEKALPIEQETFSYRRNVQECKRLQRSIGRLQGKSLETPDAETESAFTDLIQLAWLEQKKAYWIEPNYYTPLFRHAVDTACAEVNQFLVGQKNTRTLESFKSAHHRPVFLRDEFHYLLKGNPSTSAGVFHSMSGFIEVRIPEAASINDEWDIYLIAVHELIHGVSYVDGNRLGIDRMLLDPGLEKLNEAITQIITFAIASLHLEKRKSFLVGQNKQRLSLGNMPYREYTGIVRDFFAKIPQEYFADAMLNHGGWERLRAKFMEIAGNEHALILFARNLRALYLSPEQRKKEAEATTAATVTATSPEMGRLIPLRRSFAGSSSEQVED